MTIDDAYTCIHSTRGLCAACRAEYDYDPDSWVEFGQHPDGIRRWQELQAEIAAEKPAEVAADPNLPF